MSAATPDDVAVSLMRDLNATETKYVQPLLDRAERLLVSRIPGLLYRATAGIGPVSLQLIADVEAEMVARVLRAPDGGGIYRQETEGNYSYSLNLQVASGLLDVLDAEWTKLGLGGMETVMPETDGYLRAGRYGVRPDLQFQYTFQDHYPPAWMGDGWHPDWGGGCR